MRGASKAVVMGTFSAESAGQGGILLPGGTTPNRVYRVALPAGGTAIRKVLSLETPEMRAQGERELSFYTSGLVAALPSRCRAPRLLAPPLRRANGTAELLLEDVGACGPRTLRALCRAAADLAHLHATFWDRCPQAPWMLPAGGRIPYASVALARSAVVAGAAVLGGERRALLSLLDGLDRLAARRRSAVQTLGHGDYWSANLAVGSHTVALDWSDTGPAAAGEDLGVMAWTTVWFGKYPWRRYEALLTALFAAYQREAGALLGRAPSLDALREGAELAIASRFFAWALAEELPAALGWRSPSPRWPRRRGPAFTSWWAGALGGMAGRLGPLRA